MPKQPHSRALSPAKRRAAVEKSVRYQLRRKAEGRCVTCGKLRSRLSKNYCPAHRVEKAKRVRAWQIRNVERHLATKAAYRARLRAGKKKAKRAG